MKTYLYFIIFLFVCSVATAQHTNTSKIYKYDSNDGGILYTMTRGNEWAIINLGTSASGGDAKSKLFNMNTGESFTVKYGNYVLDFRMASNDGNIVVGHISDRAMTYDRAKNILHVYPNRPLWKNGQLEDVTPDGKYAVGFYEGYLGKADNSDIPNDWFYRTLFVNVETGDTIHTPNLPNRNYQSIKFTSITPDGRYISGAADWYLGNGFHFIYDTKEQKSIMNTSLMQIYGGDIAKRYPYVESCNGSMISADGNAIGGSARIRRTNSDGTQSVISVPCVYFRDRDELKVYADAEDGGVNIEAMDNAGTFFGINETGSPLRSFKILYDGKYWVTLNQICKQRYGYDFFEKTSYERTGTIMGVSGDGHKFISFPDPMGESYCFDFGESVEDACTDLDFLSVSATTPESNSEICIISSVEVKFERAVQILGSGKDVHIYDSKGNLIANGLTSTGGLTMKTNSTQTVIANFRARSMNEGEQYTVKIDAGAIATANDRNYVNKDIELHFIGRDSKPVAVTECIPKPGTKVLKFDNTSNYIMLSFDCKVKLTDNPLAYIERAEDGSRLCTLSMMPGVIESTKNKILLTPTSTVNLYADQEYRLIVEPGSISDYSGNSASYNERIEYAYTGTYERIVPSGNILFQDSWDDISESLQQWLRYEGDHLQPLASMQNMAFDADNQPWNFSIRESEESYDYCAGSHSMYVPSGQSDDWMMTPQIQMPAEGTCTLEFDAQSYIAERNDMLEVYVYEEEWVLSYLNDEWMKEIKEKAVLVMNERIYPGKTQEGLSGEWTHYTIDLTPWNGKGIYIAFVNRNTNQSAIFIDNVIVQREQKYQLMFSNDDRVVNKDEAIISGKIRFLKDDRISDIVLTLKDANGKIVSKKEWHNILGNLKDKELPFTFDKPLPLAVGAVNDYSIDIQLGNWSDTFKGTISNLVFQPVKRVVLEEMTGVDCMNCPLGIVTIEKLEKTFGDRFIPISIHSYPGDPFESGMTSYSNYLGLMAAPTARINRIKGIYHPMISVGSTYYDTNPINPLWYDVVSEEMNKLGLCNMDITAMRSKDGRDIIYSADVNYAVSMNNQRLSLMFVVLEDELVSYQINGFGTIDQSILGEWGKDGKYDGHENSGYVYPYENKDVARAIVGTTLSGTYGLFPQSFVAGRSYTASITAPLPANIVNEDNVRIVGMLINTDSGEVINAARTNIKPFDENVGIETCLLAEKHVNTNVYTLSGQLVKGNVSTSDISSLPKGFYIVGGKKMLVK